MNKGNNLAIVLITHNRVEYTRRTLDSLFRTVPEAKIIIVDNNSDEMGMGAYLESLTFTRTENKEFNVLFLEANLGWGAAVQIALNQMNAGMPKCQCGDLHDFSSDYILISNNDVEYEDGWYDKCISLYEEYPHIGILGVWKHPSHGILAETTNLIVKDQMPAVGWLMTPEHLKDIGDFKENGPCSTKGGNGEDVDYCIRTINKGYLVASPKRDVAIHIDGY